MELKSPKLPEEMSNFVNYIISLCTHCLDCVLIKYGWIKNVVHLCHMKKNTVKHGKGKTFTIIITLIIQYVLCLSIRDVF